MIKTQAFTNQISNPKLGLCWRFDTSGNIFSNFFWVYFLVLIFSIGCSKSSSVSSKATDNSNNSTPTSPKPNPGTGFPSSNELRTLLGNDPAYQGFVRCLNQDALLAYINVREEYDFVLLVPNEINQDPNYIKKYLSEEADPRDRLQFWLSHMTVASKGIPWTGNPSIYQLMLKRDGSIIRYDGGTANITKEKTLKDGTQIIFIDKPIKINVRQ